MIELLSFIKNLEKDSFLLGMVVTKAPWELIREGFFHIEKEYIIEKIRNIGDITSNYTTTTPYTILYYYLVWAFLLGSIIVILSKVLGTKFRILDNEKLSIFECGFTPIKDSKGFGQIFKVSFYRISILFILFDIEISFLFPWTTSYLTHLFPFDYPEHLYNNNSFYFSIYIFLFILVLGLLYEHKKKALKF